MILIAVFSDIDEAVLYVFVAKVLHNNSVVCVFYVV